MKVLVIVSYAENLRDLQIVMIARPNGFTMVSPVVTLKDMMLRRDWNPYCVYGKAIEEFTGCEQYTYDITIADCRSGNLDGWE